MVYVFSPQKSKDSLKELTCLPSHTSRIHSGVPEPSRCW